MVIGVLTGFGESVSGSFDNCLDDAKAAMADIKVIVQDLMTKDKKQIEKAIKEMVELAKLVPRAVLDCKKVVVNVEKMTKAIAAMATP